MSSIRLARPAPPPRAQAAQGGQQAGGWGRAHFCWAGSSPHQGPLHTLRRLPLSWDAGGVGRSPRVPHHPCGFPALCPHVHPQSLGCPRLDRPSVSSWDQIRSPDGCRSRRRQPLPLLDSLAQAAWKPPPVGVQGAVWLGLRKRDPSGLCPAQATPSWQSLRSRPPGDTVGPPHTVVTTETPDRQGGHPSSNSHCPHPTRVDSRLPRAGRGLWWAGGDGCAPARLRGPGAHHEGCPQDRVQQGTLRG